MKYFLTIFVFICAGVALILGVRGRISTEPPIYVFPDMDNQAKYKAQYSNDFFQNQMNDRLPPQYTVSRGQGFELGQVFSGEFKYGPSVNEILYTGKNPSTGEFYKGFPIPVTMDLMKLGQAKYNTLCYVCHGLAGNGNGITKSYGMIAVPCFHREERFYNMPEGEIFNTITHGKGQMLPYADKLTPEERWAVVLYVKALLRSQNARIDDVPADKRDKLPELGK